jgi:hypothetical protein
VRRWGWRISVARAEVDGDVEGGFIGEVVMLEAFGHLAEL